MTERFYNSYSTHRTICRDKLRYNKILDEQEVVGLLNHLHQENEQLRQELQKKQEEERLYANEILELRKTNEEFIQFKELGGDY